MTQQIVNGFEVRCAVAQRGDGQYAVVILTGTAQGINQTSREWKVPGARTFPTPVEAERYGRYVLLGISKVSPDGEPFFTVV